MDYELSVETMYCTGRERYVPVTAIFKIIYLRQEAAILDFKMAAICFTLLCTSFPVALWKENKDSLYLEKWLLCGDCHHMAALSKFKMAATLLYMQFSKRDRCRLHWFFISPSRSGSDGSHIQFHDDGCIAGPFQCH